MELGTIRRKLVNMATMLEVITRASRQEIVGNGWVNKLPLKARYTAKLLIFVCLL